MLYTNGVIIIHSQNNIDELNQAINQVVQTLEEEEVEVFFNYEEEPYPHYKIPEGVDYEILKRILGYDLEFKAIDQEKVSLPDIMEREIRYEYSREELDKIFQALAEMVQTKHLWEEEKKGMVDHYNRKIKDAEVVITDLAKKKIDGFEMRKVQVKKVVDFITKTVWFHNIETGKVVDTQPLGNEDRQLSIFMQDGQVVFPDMPKQLFPIESVSSDPREEDNQED